MSSLEEKRFTMYNYLRMKMDEEDWHGVMDAAADLREIDVEIRIRKNEIRKNEMDAKSPGEPYNLNKSSR